jgi:hypothetical protein
MKRSLPLYSFEGYFTERKRPRTLDKYQHLVVESVKCSVGPIFPTIVHGKGSCEVYVEPFDIPLSSFLHPDLNKEGCNYPRVLVHDSITLTSVSAHFNFDRSTHGFCFTSSFELCGDAGDEACSYRLPTHSLHWGIPGAPYAMNEAPIYASGSPCWEDDYSDDHHVRRIPFDGDHPWQHEFAVFSYRVGLCRDFNYRTSQCCVRLDGFKWDMHPRAGVCNALTASPPEYLFKVLWSCNIPLLPEIKNLIQGLLFAYGLVYVCGTVKLEMSFSTR